jgi:hypothetical protein
MNEWQLWVAGLTGGLAGAVLTQLVQLGRACWLKPVLSVDFSEGDSGCIVEDVEAKAMSEQAQTPADPQGALFKLKYLRLGVRNTGRTTALDVQVIVDKITVVESKQTTYRGEVMDFGWAHIGFKADIPSNTRRFADICKCAYSDNPTSLWLCAPTGWAKFQKDNPAGKFSLDVYVAARNAKTVPKTITFQFQRTAESLTIPSSGGVSNHRP